MRSLLPLPLIALTLLPLQAQSRFGLEIGTTSAQGGLRDGLKDGGGDRVGSTLGATFRLHSFQPRTALSGEDGSVSFRLRASALAYPERPRPGTGIDVTGASVNFEVVPTFGKDLTGFQLITGFGLAQWERKSAAGTLTTRRPVTTLGAGWQWRHVGVEARWNTSSFSAGQSANSLDTVLTVRF